MSEWFTFPLIVNDLRWSLFGLWLPSFSSFQISSDSPLFHSFVITIPGFGDTEVSIEMICDCDCASIKEPNSSKCNSQGTYSCARCTCNEGRYGDVCQCDGNEQKDISSCKHNNVTDKICSDFGTCVCGVCKCNVREVRKIDYPRGHFCMLQQFVNREWFELKFSSIVWLSYLISICIQ